MTRLLAALLLLATPAAAEECTGLPKAYTKARMEDQAPVHRTFRDDVEIDFFLEIWDALGLGELEARPDEVVAYVTGDAVFAVYYAGPCAMGVTVIGADLLKKWQVMMEGERV